MATISENDLTIIYYTAERAPEMFRAATQNRLLESLNIFPAPVAFVTRNRFQLEEKKGVFDIELPYGTASIYRQVLKGAQLANTKYVACCEDDVLYSPEHFKFRPKTGHWGYNMNTWSIFTWGEPMFTQKPGGRRNLSQLICERQLLIDHLEERFKLWPGKVDINIFGEPGKYDNQLGTTPYPSQDFYTNPPNIVFSHQANLQFQGLGTRKGLGQIRATEIPYWGRATGVVSLYNGSNNEKN